MVGTRVARTSIVPFDFDVTVGPGPKSNLRSILHTQEIRQKQGGVKLKEVVRT